MRRPIRVVMFGSGPVLTHDARRFLCRLEAEPEIELLGAFCQASSSSLWAVAEDLWRRRGILALPLLIARIGNGVFRFLQAPRRELAMRRELAGLSDRVHFIPDVHAMAVVDRLRALRADLGLVYGSPILKPEVFEACSLGSLGIHHGKLPEYRGNKTTFWAMYNGEDTAGVTIQKINAGLDTGEIVKEGSVTIGRRSPRSVWRELENLGLDLYLRAILEVKNGLAVYRPQSGRKGKLYRNPKLTDLVRFQVLQMKRRLGLGSK